MHKNSHNGTINAMSTIFLNGAKASKRVSYILQPLYLSSCSVRYASINSGINRGLRKSKGVGFRGKERSRENDGAGRGFQIPRSDPYRRDSGPVDDLGRKNKFMHTRFKGDDRDNESKPKYNAPSGFEDRQDRGNHWEGKSENFKRLRAKGSYGEESFDTYKEPRSSKPGYVKKSYSSYGSGEETAGYQKRSIGRPHESPEKRRAEEKDSINKSFGSPRDILNHRQKSYPNFGENLARNLILSEFSAPKTSSSFAKNIPISIPYTTPASEFLYGTSVVEAALNTQRRKSRKLYKLYIHKGEDRHNGDRDGALTRLAQRKGVEVAIVRGQDWLRTLDKMSQGRPHNGYILEASPLPRLPVISLGSVIDQNDSFAIQLAPDHQSREELEVNGNDTIINVPKDSTGRKPLVLLLDSIEDPQNLGAILRTALFMGVTAVAISVRNSASFTPVVFKASAGAAETIEIFSVNKPGGFIKDSQASGWKIYAAVAPPAPRKPDSRHMWPAASQEFVWSHKLQDPLREDPCILMVGGEGEGLRKNLRDLADVHISIKGASMRGKLDSLNVSVATGMLCGAFIRQTARKTVEEAVKEVEVETESLNENQVF
ncbi:hypothetical protein SS1G_03872 [Sclerotinia sclerotiorum 1980 UF-70]|uniref:rRNA methyltransferase 1, mitochondrial n=1 Tax=Sclerotinia sclerotiorum (strain ATCC 18683 / 1980 / Ss-1) TaxID=665079 RepID=A7EEY1_SCLS1|nr:hypothetical protein SS1G_03872 [Sclerotinia sclerotiorum 1980 UF-70]EDO01397.1 hypothetical protein SS1G_03872 [Sclerotinia sclerotiorum 1980 UF-70]